MDAMIGIGQGDSDSTHFFNFLISDLPAHLHFHGIRTEWMGLMLTCLVFLDNVAAIVHTEEQVCTALDAFARYEEMWHVEFSREQGKGGVLAISGLPPSFLGLRARPHQYHLTGQIPGHQAERLALA